MQQGVQLTGRLLRELEQLRDSGQLFKFSGRVLGAQKPWNRGLQRPRSNHLECASGDDGDYEVDGDDDNIE